MNFGQTRSTRLAEKERKQREYKEDLERQIEAKRLREQQERMQERQQSRDRLSVNHQRETVIPLNLSPSSNRRDGDMGRSPAPVYQQHAEQSEQQGGHFQPQQQQQQQQQQQFQPLRQLRHDEAILQSEIQHSFKESSDAPSYLRGGQAAGVPDKPVSYKRHDDPLLKSEIQHSFQESADAPSYLQAPQFAPVRAQEKAFQQPSQTFYKKLEEERRKLEYGEELRQQMREQKERKERERRLWKFGEPANMYSGSPQQPRHDDPILKNEIQHSFRESSDAPSYLRSHVQAASNHQPQAAPPMHGEQVLKNEYSHAYQQSSGSPSRIPRHDDAILKSEIQHAFQESSDSPSYLRDHGQDKRQQPMVHFRSDYRDMTRMEIEAKQKKAQDLHNDLRRQMEEKKAAKQREKEERMREEQEENERVRREQEQLRLQFEGENSRKHRSRKAHAAPFINLSSNEGGEKEATKMHQALSATPARNVSKSETMSHPSFSIPEKKKPVAPRDPSPVGRLEREREREEKPSIAPQTPRASLSTPLVEKKIASSVDSIRDELVSNQESVIQAIHEQRQALVAETESTRQEMLQMKNMLQEYQVSVHQMEKMHSEQMQMQNAFALIKQQEMDEMRQSQEDQQLMAPPPPVEYERSETPSWVKQSMKQGNGMDLMQSLQADSTLVFPAHEQPEAEPAPALSHQSPLKASMDHGIIPVVENGVVDLRLDSESNYVSQEDEWQQHQAPPPPSFPSAGFNEVRRNLSRNPSVASSVTTLNVEELYERNASKLKMLEDLEGVDDMDEIDQKLNQFLSTRRDSFSNPLENFSELDYNSEQLNVNDLMESERLSTPCLPAESDWIS